ncbi:MAG: DUF1178 family protein [Proteobacteria bacterium]|nr:DUF1178 family protein [Pseudomonadota bacterium]
MIRYDLVCDKGHEFDGWFSNSEAFDKQAKRGFVECTVCGSARVQKQLMRPSIGAKSNRKVEAPAQKMVAGEADPRLQAMMQIVRDYRKHVETTAENVGDRFADEARKIHYGESEERGIYGNATGNEARDLIEEGIAIHPLPRLPEDGN